MWHKQYNIENTTGSYKLFLINGLCNMLAFGTSIFLSAFLLFIVQPLLAKKLLPWFGGAPTVWLCIILFFQSMLLIGYLYAYFLAKISRVSIQVGIHISLLCLSLCFIPLVPLESYAALPVWPPIAIFALLSMTLLLPVAIISSTSPLLQHWYCHTYQSVFPYRFYALSNLGSLLGLLAFPFLLEPYLGLDHQLSLWSLFYGVYFVSSGICLILVARKGHTHIIPSKAAEAVRPSKHHIVSWLILTALSCALLLSTTQIMMQNVISFPLLWIIPLTLYLLTFIITFSTPRSYYRPFWMIVYAALTGLLFYIPSHHQFFLMVQICMFSGLIFSGCMICHGEVAKLKPHPQYLTFYYLILACGGVLGAMLVNIVAPLFFTEWWEFYVTLLGILLYSGYLVFYKQTPQPGRVFSVSKYTWQGACVGLAGLLAFHIHKTNEDVIMHHRNFFGKAEIVEKYSASDYHLRQLRNGSIIHGQQYLDPEKRLSATTYFSPQSGVGLAMDFQRQHKFIQKGLRIGVIGLGTGTIAALTQPDDDLHFYEIDPDIEAIARKYFYYLADAPAKTQVSIGDGRMILAKALQNQGSENYDILAIDAFNGDAIPLHLLTIEAMQIYLSHLNPTGLLAIHISSRYMDLFPPIQSLAQSLGLNAYIAANHSDNLNSVYVSEWVLISRQTDIGLFLFQKGALTFNQQRMDKPWTDDRNNLLSVVKW